MASGNPIFEIVDIQGMLIQNYNEHYLDLSPCNKCQLFRVPQQLSLFAKTSKTQSTFDKQRYVFFKNQQQRDKLLKTEPILFYICYFDGRNKIIKINPYQSVGWLKNKLEQETNTKIKLTINNKDLTEESDSLRKNIYDKSIVHVNKIKYRNQTNPEFNHQTQILRIRVRKFTKQKGQQHVLNISQMLTIKQLIKNISQLFNIPQQFIRLVSGGKLLQTNKLVADYDILNEGVINIADSRTHTRRLSTKQYEQYLSIIKSAKENNNSNIDSMEQSKQNLLSIEGHPKQSENKYDEKIIKKDIQFDNQQKVKLNPESPNPNQIRLQSSIPLVISGCSGAGKGTLVKYLLQRYPDIFQLSVSYTTRSPRPGQNHGVQYYFVSVQEFERQIKRNVFVESGKIYGNYYGTHKSQLQRIAKKQKICILEIDLKAAQKIYKQTPNCHFLFINIREFQELRARMLKRGTESPQKIQTRMNHSRTELQKIKQLKFYQQIFNQNLQDTKRDLIRFLRRRYGNIFE